MSQTVYVDPVLSTGLQVTRLAVIKAVDMTAAAAAYFAFTNPTTSGHVVWLAYVAFGSFSGFSKGAAAPTSFATSWGTNSTTSPNNMRAATAWGSGVLLPFQIAQQTDTLDPRIYPGQSLYFAVTTNTGGVGTMDVGFHGAWI
jgi:hypothetical protein